MRCLQDIIPREYFPILQDAQDWAHAKINFAAPLQMPATAHPGYFPEAERSKRANEVGSKAKAGLSKQKAYFLFNRLCYVIAPK